MNQNFLKDRNLYSLEYKCNLAINKRNVKNPK
jgi:hypothetical protein